MSIVAVSFVIIGLTIWANEMANKMRVIEMPIMANEVSPTKTYSCDNVLTRKSNVSNIN